MPTLLRVVKGELPKSGTGKVIKKVLGPQYFPDNFRSLPEVQVWDREPAQQKSKSSWSNSNSPRVETICEAVEHQTTGMTTQLTTDTRSTSMKSRARSYTSRSVSLRLLSTSMASRLLQFLFDRRCIVHLSRETLVRSKYLLNRTRKANAVAGCSPTPPICCDLEYCRKRYGVSADRPNVCLVV